MSLPYKSHDGSESGKQKPELSPGRRRKVFARAGIRTPCVLSGGPSTLRLAAVAGCGIPRCHAPFPSVSARSITRWRAVPSSHHAGAALSPEQFEGL